MGAKAYVSAILTASTMKIGEFNPLDAKFVPKKPEPGFSVRKNKKVIADTIKKYDKQREKKMAEFREKLGERTDAVASYLAGRGGASRSRSVEKYFGKVNLAHLRGEDIKTQLMKEQAMMIGSNKQLTHEQQDAQKEITKSILKGDVSKIKRTNAKEKE